MCIAGYCLKYSFNKPLEEGAFTQKTKMRTCSGVEHGEIRRSNSPSCDLGNSLWTRQYHKQGVGEEKWLLTAYIVAQYNEALKKMTENASGTWSDQ